MRRSSPLKRAGRYGNARPGPAAVLLPLATLMVWGAIVAPHADSALTPPSEPSDEGVLHVLCGIVPALDELLRCAAQTTKPTETKSSSSQAPPPPAPGSGPTVIAAGATRPTVPTARFDPALLLVTFRKDATRLQIVSLLHSLKAKLVRTIPKIGVGVVRVSPRRRDAVRAALRRSGLVDAAQRDPILQAFDTTPNDTLWPSQWGLRELDLPRAWDLTRGVPSVVVAVVDTGVNASHPDLRAAVLPGLDVTSSGGGTGDPEGHGTAVAGIIASRTDNVTGQAGVCWSCELLPIKVLDASGVGDTSVVATGIVAAVDLGARVINLSLGGPTPTQALADAVAYAQQKGVVVVAAAGNSATAAQFYPAAYPGVVAVAATDPGRHLYAWSDYGDWVSVAAPGCNVAPTLSGGYSDFCGTSSATPIVAGLAALAISAAPAATSAQIVAALENGALPIGGVRYGSVQAEQTLAALGVRVPTRVLTTKMTGTLTRAIPTRRLVRAFAPGRVAVSLLAAGAGKLSLSVTAASGARLARRSGESPLRFAVVSNGGRLRFVIAGPPAKRRFVLSVSTAAQ
jgi:subtilisin family serine protease